MFWAFLVLCWCPASDRDVGQFQALGDNGMAAILVCFSGAALWSRWSGADVWHVAGDDPICGDSRR